LGGGKFVNGAAMGAFAALMSEMTAELSHNDEASLLHDTASFPEQSSDEQKRLLASNWNEKQRRDELRMHPNGGAIDPENADLASISGWSDEDAYQAFI